MLSPWGLRNRAVRSRLAFAIALCASALGSALLLANSAGATFHGHNGRIAWASFVSDGEAGGRAAIATFSSGGGGIHPINSCSTVNIDGDPVYCEDWDRISYSPDGRRLMWDMTARAGNEVIVLANANGGGAHVIDHGSSENDFQPTFSPSGKRIAYVRAEAGSEAQIVTSNLAGGDVHVVTATITGHSPVWAPNGETIAFVHDMDIWSIGVNGHGLRRLIRNGQEPDFSPDGRQIVYINNGGIISYSGTLYLARADGTHRHKVPTTGNCCKLVESVVFSPDGKRLALGLLSNDNAAKLKLMTLPVTGGRPKLIYARSTNGNAGVSTSVSWEARR